MEVSPRTRQEIARQTSGDNHEALEPHSDVRGDADDEHHPQIGAQALEPVKLRYEDVARIHRPRGPPVRAEGAIEESETLVDVAAVPGDEKLAGIRITDHRTRHQDDLVHVLQVLDGAPVLQ